MIILCYISITAVSASEDNSTMIFNETNEVNNIALESKLDNSSNFFNHNQLDIYASQQDEVPDVPDLNVIDKNYVYPSNIESYFKYGVLDKKYQGKTLIFSGNFTNIGVLKINQDSVTVDGSNAYLKNTVFDIEANNVTLKGLILDLNRNFRDNDGAAISVAGSNINLIDVDINYIVPSDVDAYAIFADGYNRYSSNNLKIINCSIYFEGHNDNVNRYNCAVKLTNVENGFMENNTIITSLPLKNVKYGVDGASIDSDFVFSVGIENCNGFIFNNNTVIADINKRTAVLFPTQNCIMLSQSDDVIVSNNSVYMTDFVTFPGIESYIYGIDIYRMNNLTVIKNKVSIISTGGKLALGTAYPIQISGPITKVNITENDLYSFSNGPNIGIYSQNFYGATDLSVTNNKINVTGLAGTHEWALVAGIESQDTNAEIINNTIEVHSVGVVNLNDNIYGISYRQSTAGEHTFNIHNNTAFSDGFYAVYLLSSDYSSIVNNTLISYNPNAIGGSDSYARGPRTHNGDYAFNNVVITIQDYLNSRNNINVNPDSDSRNSNSNNINANPNSNSDNSQNTHNTNPLIPHYSNNIGQRDESGNENTGLIDFVDDGSVQGTIGDYTGFNKRNSDSKIKNTNNNDRQNNKNSNVESTNFNTTDLKGASANAISNSSDATPSIEGDNSNPLGKSQSSDSSSESQSVSKKAFELDEMKKSEDFVPSIFFIIIALILLIVGFRRKNTEFN